MAWGCKETISSRNEPDERKASRIIVPVCLPKLLGNWARTRRTFASPRKVPLGLQALRTIQLCRLTEAI